MAAQRNTKTRPTVRTQVPARPDGKTGDLRYRRTERHLHEALAHELAERPLRKVKVTQVARRAEVSTAAFYLHYHDIFELAESYAREFARQQVEEMDFLDEFFSAPRDFARHFVSYFDSRRERGKLIFDNRLVNPYFDQLVKSLKERLDEIGGSGNEESEVFLTFLVHGLMSLMPNFPDRLDMAAEVAGEALENLQAGNKLRHGA